MLSLWTEQEFDLILKLLNVKPSITIFITQLCSKVLQYAQAQENDPNPAYRSGLPTSSCAYVH
jgi:hypothetical protein